MKAQMEAMMKTFAAATPVPRSTASSSTGPVPAATPDADWMNDLEDITIEWGDMDKEQLDNLKTNKSARLALAALWQQPSRKKVRKYDPLTKDYTPVDTYNVTQQGSHQPTDLADAFLEDNTLLAAFKEYHSNQLMPRLNDLANSLNSAGNVLFDRTLAIESRSSNNKGNSMELLALHLWDQSEHALLFTMLLTIIALTH